MWAHRAATMHEQITTASQPHQERAFAQIKTKIQACMQHNKTQLHQPTLAQIVTIHTRSGKKKMLTNHSPQAHSKHTLHDDRNPCTSFRSEQHTRFCTPPLSHFHLFNHTISTAAFPKAKPKVRGHCRLRYMR